MTLIPQFLTGASNTNDYRPAIASDGDTIVYEHSVAGSPTKLFQLSVTGARPAGGFLSGTGVPVEQTRPDWHWPTDRLLFIGSPEENGDLYVHWVERDGRNPTLIEGAAYSAYEPWSGR